MKLEVPPEPVGVPVIAPVEGLMPSPAGSEPELIDHVYGVVPPDTETDWL